MWYDGLRVIIYLLFIIWYFENAVVWYYGF